MLYVSKGLLTLISNYRHLKCGLPTTVVGDAM